MRAIMIGLLISASAIAAEPKKPEPSKPPVKQEAQKPSIPDDLKPVCYKGQLGAYSDKAQEAILWPVACNTGEKSI